MSLRLKVTLLFVLLVGVLLSVFSVIVYYNTVNIRTKSFYDRLWERVEITTQFLNASGGTDLDSIHPSLRNKYWTTLPEEEIIVFSGKKDFFYINEYKPVQFDYSEIWRQIDKGEEVEIQLGQRQYVGCSKLIGNHYSEIVVSAFDRNGKRLLDNLKITLLYANLIFLLIIVLVGLYFSNKTFAPIIRIINSAEKISASGLNLRVPIPSGKGELAELAKTINDSLSRIETAFLVQKSFVGNASHELRTPITALSGELELALMKERTPEYYRMVISSALDDARRLSRLIDQLLLFAQTTAARDLPSKQKLRIDEILFDLFEKKSRKYRDRKIDFSIVETGIDEEMLVVHGNEQLLSSAIGNILDNALKYSAEGSVVIVELTQGDQHIIITIRDQGEGISSSDIPYVFEPFYRSENTIDLDGFGIGLSLAHRIIELHSGSLVLQSQIGTGTTVSIKLPVFPEKSL